jgi:hypothetical protein
MLIKFATDVTHSMTVRARAIAAAERTLSRVQAVSVASRLICSAMAVIASTTPFIAWAASSSRPVAVPAA